MTLSKTSSSWMPFKLRKLSNIRIFITSKLSISIGHVLGYVVELKQKLRGWCHGDLEYCPSVLTYSAFFLT